MDAQDLFNRVQSLWPNSIDPSGAVEVYREIERQIGESDDWLSLGAWAFHQALWKHVVSNIERHESTLNPSVVSFEDFDLKIRRNLADESWAGVRAEYDPALR